MSVVSKYPDKVSRIMDTFESGIKSDDEKKTLKTSGFRLVIMYALPKMHKSGLPMRPILSTLNSCNCRLSKYMVELQNYLL